MSADADVVVIGGGIAGLVVAHQVARAGRSVVLCEASGALGGLLQRGTVGGVAIDLGAESFATRTDAVARLVADAGLDLELVSPEPAGAWLAVATGDGPMRARLPRRTVLGIPADPLAPDVVAILGETAARRAAAEPTGAIPTADGTAASASLHALVAERLGPLVADRLVEPLCRSVYSRPATEVTLEAVHPALWRAFRQHGSLLQAADAVATAARAGAAVGGIDGGMWRLPVALADAAARHGADLRTGTAVTALTADAAGVTVHTAAGPIRARDVVVATGPAATDRLLAALPNAAAVPAVADPPSPARDAATGDVHLVAAAITHPGLDADPVGSGVIVDPALATAAKALTHVTAKWGWARRAAGAAGIHLVRLSARDGAAARLRTSDDIARELRLLTGVAVTARDIADVVVQRWTDAVDIAPAGSAAARLARASARGGIHLTGAAVAGTGLASVIPHARDLAAQLTADAPAVPRPLASDRSTA
ncbi:FAD-dependent oxidoreductase [Microbacterium aurum]|uniref:protoporphyrinogen/coproporphyrinogen oxidase n=1 Tax=Microbacterium aurum TaxID=36805 RepID=UPI0028E4B10D|nr:FAD-dependent oxidoreductase [Microbacterium aurum]